MLEASDRVVLEIQQPKAIFSLEDWADGQVASIEVESVWIDGPFLWRPVDNRDTWNNWRFCKDDVIFARDVGRGGIRGSGRVDQVGGMWGAAFGTRESALGEGSGGWRVMGGSVVPAAPLEGGGTNRV